MKKKISCWVLVLILIFGMNTNAYAGVTNTSGKSGTVTIYAALTVTSSKLVAYSTASSAKYHKHKVTMSIRGKAGSSYKTFSKTYTVSSSSEISSMTGTYKPSSFSYSQYTGSSFTGTQKCVYTYWSSVLDSTSLTLTTSP